MLQLENTSPSLKCNYQQLIAHKFLERLYLLPFQKLRQFVQLFYLLSFPPRSSFPSTQPSKPLKIEETTMNCCAIITTGCVGVSIDSGDTCPWTTSPMASGRSTRSRATLGTDKRQTFPLRYQYNSTSFEFILNECFHSWTIHLQAIENILRSQLFQEGAH